MKRSSYKWSTGHIWVLLVEVLLKLWKLVKVPVFLPQPLAWIAKLSYRRPTSTASTTTSTKTRRASTIPVEERDGYSNVSLKHSQQHKTFI